MEVEPEVPAKPPEKEPIVTESDVVCQIIAEPQTCPGCTADGMGQWNFAFYKNREACARLCTEGRAKSLLASKDETTTASTQLLWGKAQEMVESGKYDDRAIYQELRAVSIGALDQGAREQVEERKTDLDRLKARRMERRWSSVLKLLRTTPDWGSRRPTAVLDFGCGRSLELVEKIAEELDCEGFAVDPMWAPGDIEERPGVTYVQLEKYPDFRLPFPDGSFDVISALMSLHHIPNVHNTVSELVRVLKPGGALIIREHDCTTKELGVVLDLQHGLHNFVWAKQVGGQSPSVSSFFKEHWAHYRSKTEWQDIMKKQSLELCSSIDDWLDEVDRTYYDVFQKPGKPTVPEQIVYVDPRRPLLWKDSKGNDVLAKTVKVGPIPFDANAQRIQQAVARMGNLERRLRDRIDDKKGSTLFGKEPWVKARPVLIPLLGQVGKAFSVEVSDRKRLKELDDNAIKLLTSRLFLTKEAATRWCEDTVASWVGKSRIGSTFNESKFGIIIRESSESDDNAWCKVLRSHLLELLTAAREKEVILLFNKFGETPLHELWCDVLKELKWPYPVVSVHREVEARVFDEWNSSEDQADNSHGQYMWVEAGNEAARLLDKKMSQAEFEPYSQKLPIDRISPVVTHVFTTTGARVGSDIEVMFDLADLLASGDGKEKQPITSVLINGGPSFVLQAASACAKRQIPVIAFAGTGRLADLTQHILNDDEFDLDDNAELIATTMQFPGRNSARKVEKDMLKDYLQGRLITIKLTDEDVIGGLYGALLKEKRSSKGGLAMEQLRIGDEDGSDLLTKASDELAMLNVKWVPARYLRDLNAAGKALLRCQEIPKDAFVTISGDPAKSKTRPIAISHPWLSKDHPDLPDRVKLKTLVSKLDALKVDPGTPIFMDYLALPQKTLDGKDDRSAQEYKLFKDSLNDDMFRVYSLARVLVLDTVPKRAEVINTLPYVDRGWCFFEMTIAILCGNLMLIPGKMSEQKFLMWQYTIDALGREDDLEDNFLRNWEKLLSTKRFTNGTESTTVAAQFKNNLKVMKATAKKLAVSIDMQKKHDEFSKLEKELRDVKFGGSFGA